MPRTRIRQKAALVVSTGGSQVGDGSNPPGSSLTVDGFAIAIQQDETTATPADAATFALAVQSGMTFVDDFNRPNGPLGNGWVTADGTPSVISSNRAVNTSGGSNLVLQSAGSTTEVEIAGDFDRAGGSVTLAYSTSATGASGYEIQISVANTVTLRERAKPGFASRAVAPAVSGPPVSGKFRLLREGNRHRLFFDGVVFFDATDTVDATAGDRAGFGLTNGASLDNFALYNESAVTAPTEGLSFGITAATDTAAAPGDGRRFQAVIGATTVTATNTAGTGWTNPANAQGPSDDISATMTGAAGLSPARQTGSLVGSYASVGTPSEVYGTTVTATFHYSFTVAALTTGSFLVELSTNGGQSYSTALSLSASGTGPGAASVTLPITSLANFRFRVTASVQGSAIAASSATLDAVTLTYTTP